MKDVTVKAVAKAVTGYYATLSAYYLDASSEEVEIDIAEDGTFTMPEAAVTVEAKYTAYAAKIGSTYYKTLDEAVSACPYFTAEATTITLCNNVEETTAIWCGQKIILDLNGYTLSKTTSHKYIDACPIDNYGELTVKDSSTANTGAIIAKNDLGTARAISSGDSLTILSGSIKADGATAMAVDSSGDELNISGGRFSGDIISGCAVTKITGGLFDTDVSELLGDDYICIANTDEETKDTYGYTVVPAVTVTYTVGDTTYSTIKVPKGTAVANLTAAQKPAKDPEKTGYTFKGWLFGETTVLNENATATADFSINSYKLTINYISAVAGFTAPTKYETNVNYGASYSQDSPSVTGYVCDTTTVSGTMGASDVTVNVTYYKVTFTWDGATAKANAGTVIVAQTATVDNGTVTKNPTCTVNGTTKYTASYTAQNQTFTDEKSIDDVPATEHVNKVSHDAVPATCLAAGNIAYYYCPDCKCYFKADMTATTAEGIVIAKLDHEYEFAADTTAHTVTATCKNGCNDAQVLTLTAPENAVYDGNAKAATADKTVLGGENVGAVSYFVMNAQGGWDAAAEAVNAGSYKAEVSVGGVTTEATFAIAKAAPVITVSCADIEEDAAPAPVYEVKGSDATPVITYSADNENYGTWDEVYDGVGTYYVKVYVAETDNYEEAEETASFTVKSSVPPCYHVQIVPIAEGKLLLYLNNVQVGYVTLTQKDGKWAINVEGKGYIYYNGSIVVYRDDPYYWDYNGIGFYTVTTKTTGVIFKKTKQAAYYLSYSGNDTQGYPLTTKGVAAVFMTYAADEEHQLAYRDNGDGTHTQFCTKCSAEFGVYNCEYDASTHLCSFCGHYDPAAIGVTCDVSVLRTYNTSSWTRFWHGDYTYSVAITAVATGDVIKTIRYSTDGKNWTEGHVFSQYKPVDTLYVSVETHLSGTYYFVYRDGVVTPTGRT